MKVSNKGIDLIKEFEGLSLKAYLCTGGKWTIGYGHTDNVIKGMVITEKQALSFLKTDLIEVEKGLNAALKVKLNQNQFDALASFVFNLGITNLLSSTLLKKVNLNSSDAKIAIELNRWVYSGGQPTDGLKRRRLAEIELYFTK